MQASIFHYGSIGLIEEPCRSTLLAATEIAKQSGCILSYDPNLRVPLWPSEDVAREGIMSIWNKADVIKVSEDEITFLTGNDDDAAIEKLYHANLKLLIVTEGAGGCRYYTKESKGRVDSHKVDAVDTTGAGDAFVAGLLNSLASDPTLYKEEEKLREALVFANGCGALTVMEKGAIPSLPTKEKVLKFLK
ncbi:probable fructokinase-7 [Camellia sinensis]|uniref:probable fructokinase-7 n=1 Tax=Camellia sinensis TaxID=4442 RepID=UPI00103673F2|nr:probable fructokinase-7 [Camellia sinensis]